MARNLLGSDDLEPLVRPVLLRTPQDRLNECLPVLLDAVHVDAAPDQ